MIAAFNSQIIALDNLSSLEPWLSDLLCVISSGGGYSTRQLYTDDGERIFDSCRPILLTGINEVAVRPDLLDRTLLVTLPVISDSQRRQEAEFWRAFRDAAPSILGAFLDGVAVALGNVDAISLDVLPRMADFAVWSTAAERCLGWAEGGFLTAYMSNLAQGNELALEESVIVPPLRRLLAGGDWPRDDEVRTADDLLRELAPLAGGPTVTARTAGWPKRARDLAGTLRRLAPVLRRSGIAVEFLPRETSGQRRRPLRIRSVGQGE